MGLCQPMIHRTDVDSCIIYHLRPYARPHGSTNECPTCRPACFHAFFIEQRAHQQEAFPDSWEVFQCLEFYWKDQPVFGLNALHVVQAPQMHHPTELPCLSMTVVQLEMSRRALLHRSHVGYDAARASIVPFNKRDASVPALGVALKTRRTRRALAVQQSAAHQWTDMDSASMTKQYHNARG